MNYMILSMGSGIRGSVRGPFFTRHRRTGAYIFRWRQVPARINDKLVPLAPSKDKYIFRWRQVPARINDSITFKKYVK